MLQTGPSETAQNGVKTLRGLAVVLGAGAAILLLTGWAAHRYRHNESALLWLRLAALGAGLNGGVFFAFSTFGMGAQQDA